MVHYRNVERLREAAGGIRAILGAGLVIGKFAGFGEDVDMHTPARAIADKRADLFGAVGGEDEDAPGAEGGEIFEPIDDERFGKGVERGEGGGLSEKNV